MSECNDTCKYYKHCWSRGEGLKEDGEDCVYYEPDRPHGKWITVCTLPIIQKCSNCKYVRNSGVEVYNFCPNCGADMREQVTENEKEGELK